MIFQLILIKFVKILIQLVILNGLISLNLKKEKYKNTKVQKTKKVQKYIAHSKSTLCEAHVYTGSFFVESCWLSSYIANN